jgi:hypothetical protein
MRTKSDHASPPVPPAQNPTTEMTSWRDGFTLVRMAVAFFFPWPFLTKNLEVSARRRATRRAARRTSGS